MSTSDVCRICADLKDGGASPQAVYAAAKQHHAERLEVIRVLRTLFGLSLAAAKEVMASVDEPSPPALPSIETREHLVGILRDELGYCSCASPNALELLARFLEAARRRTDATRDAVEFSAASRELEVCLSVDVDAGLGDWFVYGLEQRGIISHNFRVSDVWITSKGRWLLEAMQRLRF